MIPLVFNWKIAACIVVLYFLLRQKSTAKTTDDCGACDEYGTPENFAKGGLR